MGTSHAEVEFGLDEPPTFPQRTRSGRTIRTKVLQAFGRQVDAERRCHEALDGLILCLRDYVESTPPPPALRERDFRSEPDLAAGG